MYLFGYGSLINLQSAQKSFKRKLKQSDLIPVYLKGYVKVWNSIEAIKFDDLVERKGVFLNLKEEKHKKTNGVIIKVDDEELENLKLREKNYTCIEIDKQQIENLHLDEDIITFITQREDKIAKEGDKDCFIPQKYIEILTSSYPSYSDEFVKAFQSSILPFPFVVKEGKYSFSDPLQNRFAKKGLDA
jgi:hypothetical protein